MHNTSRQYYTSLRRVVAGKHFQLAAEFRLYQNIQEALDGRQIEIPATNDKVVAFALDRDEIEAKSLCGCARGDTAVGLPRVHRVGGSEVAEGDPVIAVDLPGGDPR